MIGRRAWVAALTAALPVLPGAACRGRSPDWDDRLPGESDPARAARHAAAIDVCHRCPVQVDCARLDGVSGIVAGKLREATKW